MTSPLELAADVIDAVSVMAGAGAEAEVTVVGGRSALTRFANSSIHQNVAEEYRRVSLKVVLDGRQVIAASDRTDSAAIDRLIGTALTHARLCPVDPGWPGLAPVLAATGGENYDPSTHESLPEDRAKVVRAFVGAGGPDSSAAGYCSAEGHACGFANSRGQRLEGRSSRAIVTAIHRRTSEAHCSGRGWNSSTRLSELDGHAAGAAAATKAWASADPVDLEPGSYEVVMEPACVANLVDFLVGYGFNAKAWLQGQSWVRLGEFQLDRSLAIWDNAGDRRSWGLPFDAEGTPKSRLDLVAEGVSCRLAHDRRTAAAAGGQTSTGHAIADGEQWGAFCTNLFLDSSREDQRSRLNDMIGAVERGVLVTELWYTRVLDPKTQVVTGVTRNGTFLIENGRVGRSVGDLRFTQSYVDALAPGNVLGVGDDARLTVAGPHVPSLHLRSWTFTGQASR